MTLTSARAKRSLNAYRAIVAVQYAVLVVEGGQILLVTVSGLVTGGVWWITAADVLWMVVQVGLLWYNRRLMNVWRRLVRDLRIEELEAELRGTGNV